MNICVLVLVQYGRQYIVMLYKIKFPCWLLKVEERFSLPLEAANHYFPHEYKMGDGGLLKIHNFFTVCLKRQNIVETLFKEKAMC